MKAIGNLFTSDYRIHDRVVHRSTCFRGTVVGIERTGGFVLLDVNLDRGGSMKRADRREFMLANSDRAAVIERERTDAIAHKFLSGLDASKGFSRDSILQEIEVL